MLAVKPKRAKPKRPTFDVSALRLLGYDTETTGVDQHHNCEPFFFTTCDHEGAQCYWEFDVDPVTRKVQYEPEAVAELGHHLKSHVRRGYRLVTQNGKFDATGTAKVPDLNFVWPWDQHDDTLIGGHLLASAERHDLTSMTLKELGIDIEPIELVLKKACTRARSIARTRFKTWSLAKNGNPLTLSAKGSKKSRHGGVDTPWKWDTWLPRTLAKALGYKEPDETCEHRWDEWVCTKCKGHRWWIILAEYANTDTGATVELWKKQYERIHKRELWGIYQERLKLVRITYAMENRGVTYSGDRMNKLRKQYTEEAKKAGDTCVKYSGGLLKAMPKGVTKELQQTIFDHLGLPVVAVSKKTGAPSTGKPALRLWKLTLRPQSKAHKFVANMMDFRQRTTALNYMDGYDKMSLAVDMRRYGRSWLVLHPSLNLTGTDTLRGSSNNPNGQNISKQEGFNLRYGFGPAPGREWWSLDYENIELRIPAYEAGETEMIGLFERPDEGPYYGSNHLLVAHILHPKEFEECLRTGESFKEKYKSTLYQWTKNGNFAVQYGAVETSGTADRAYHVPGGQARIKARFGNITKHNEWCIAFAEKHGYIETVTDKEYGRGYPLQCNFSKYGDGVAPTIPLNYRTQGSAMWAMGRAMVRCQDYLDELNTHSDGDYGIVLQVHDELVFDMPVSRLNCTGCRGVDFAKCETCHGLGYLPGNARKVKRLKQYMEQSGDDISIPLRVSVSYHPDNWSKEYKVAL